MFVRSTPLLACLVKLPRAIDSTGPPTACMQPFKHLSSFVVEPRGFPHPPVPPHLTGLTSSSSNYFKNLVLKYGKETSLGPRARNNKPATDLADATGRSLSS